MAGKNGGARPNAGRKPKIEEIALIERLSPMDDIALAALERGVNNGEFPFVKLFMEYRFGKAKEHTTIAIDEGTTETFMIAGKKITFK